MRKKKAGARFMDFEISPEDRIGGGATGRGRGKAKPAKAKSRKAARNERVEPGFGGGFFTRDQHDEPPPRRGRAPKGRKQPRQKKERRRLTVGRVFATLAYWLFMIGLWGAVAVGAVVAYFYLQMPAQSTWAVPERPANIRIVAADGQLISNRGKMGGEAIALKDLPEYVPAAFIAIEDKRFYQHFGIDPIGIIRAAASNLTKGHIAAGGSTLTQQLAKNLFLTRDQTLGRKVQEALLALWLEHNYTKDEILELYLNRVDFGHQMVGIEAASQFYFGHSARNLSLGEAAILAGSVKAPSNLNPKGDSTLVNARQHVVLQAMSDEGYISEAEAKAAAIDPNETIRTKVAGSESYVADWVDTLVQAYVGDVKQDIVVYTTINWDLQKQAEFLVKEAVATEGPKYHFSQGALVAVDTDGAVRAVVGGADYQQSQYNRAVTARRQPGSTFKPFVYMAAMEKGYTPDTIADDDAININGWSPNDADNKFMGKMTLRDALAYSRNTVAAQLAWNVGPDKVVEVAQRMGISSPLQAVPSIALGTQEVSLLELTAAYAPFANGGNGVIANVVTRIETADGKVLYDAVPAGPGQVIAPAVVGEMNDMLSTALDIGTGKHAKLAGWQIGGKTGTSQKARDALFVGFTARMVCGVWLGNDDDTGTNLAGGTVPTQIWSDFMAKAHEGMTPQNLPDATSAAVPASALVPNDPISALAAGGSLPSDASADASQQPAAPAKRSPKTIGDLLTGLFGGGG
ncbi:MAG TPA: PBP1A family penicillin-binding protein [Devosia sp.]|nr:PBP1A family penicillin-binding protein [Devosia sp.]